MKIRCEQHSIRLRLRKSELVQLRAEKWLETSVQFPDGKAFVWELSMPAGATDIEAHFTDGRVRVQVPQAAALRWMDTETVGMERFVPIGNGAALQILVEKDFPCKDRPDEDKSDFFVELAEDAPVTC
ncbi:MAG: hypothetical protein ABMA02_02870 [Saprospiraceae bacterium]